MRPLERDPSLDRRSSPRTLPPTRSSCQRRSESRGRVFVYRAHASDSHSSKKETTQWPAITPWIALRRDDVFLQDRLDAVGEPHDEAAGARAVGADARLHARRDAALDPGDDPCGRRHEEQEDRGGDADHEAGAEEIGGDGLLEAGHRHLEAALGGLAGATHLELRERAARGDRVGDRRDVDLVDLGEDVGGANARLVGA